MLHNERLLCKERMSWVLEKNCSSFVLAGSKLGRQPPKVSVNFFCLALGLSPPFQTCRRECSIDVIQKVTTSLPFIFEWKRDSSLGKACLVPTDSDTSGQKGFSDHWIQVFILGMWKQRQWEGKETSFKLHRQ